MAFLATLRLRLGTPLRHVHCHKSLFFLLLCKRIPIDEATQAYIARKAERCTPAQLQEVIYSLVIGHSDKSSNGQSPYLKLNTDDIDNAISKVKRDRHHLGFDMLRSRRGD